VNFNVNINPINNTKMERTKVFAYKGIIGIQSGPNAELIAHPIHGNVGCVADASKCDISPEALEALKTIKPSNDGIGDVDAFDAKDVVVFAWFGGYMRALVPDQCEVARDTDFNLLTATEGVEIPDDFKLFVDELQSTNS
jgi:hypothetical protein